MEEKKSNPTLPSNYVTLVQLQERWLKQQQSKIIQPQPQQPPPNQNHPQDQKLVPLIDGNTSSSQLQKQYVVKNRSDSETRRRAAEEDKPKLEIGAGGIGDETANLSGKVSESKKKNNNSKWKLKSKTEKRGASGEGSGTAAQGREEGKKKATIGNDLKDEKIELKEEAEHSARVSPVEQRVRVLTIKSGNGKQNGRLGKMSNGFRDYRPRRRNSYGEAHGIEEAEKKATIENEENNGGSVTPEEVVNRSVRALTINSGNLGKTSNDFGHSQSQRKHYVEAQGKAQGNQDAEKRGRIDNPLKLEEEKKKVGSVTVEEAEERVRALSINSGGVDQNKMKNGFRHSQPWRRNYYSGEASHGYGYGDRNHQHYSKVGMQRREEKMVWVKKDEIVG